MRARRSVVLGPVLALAAASPALAQTDADLAFFKDVNARVPAPPVATLEALLKNAFEQTRATNPQVCMPTAFAVSGVKPATADAGVWTGITAGQLKNAWTLHVEMPGCTLSSADYLVLKLNPPGATRDAFREIIYARGTTHAGPSLSRDGTKGAFGAVGAALTRAGVDLKDPKCSAPPVFGLREMIADKSGPDVYGVRFTGTWTEKWHFQVCAHEGAVTIDFTADGHGGAYFSADAQKTELK